MNVAYHVTVIHKLFWVEPNILSVFHARLYCGAKSIVGKVLSIQFFLFPK